MDAVGLSRGPVEEPAVDDRVAVRREAGVEDHPPAEAELLVGEQRCGTRVGLPQTEGGQRSAGGRERWPLARADAFGLSPPRRRCLPRRCRRDSRARRPGREPSGSARPAPFRDSAARSERGRVARRPAPAASSGGSSFRMARSACRRPSRQQRRAARAASRRAPPRGRTESERASDQLAADLLGGHVPDRPEHCSRLAGRGTGLVLRQPGPLVIQAAPGRNRGS